MMTGASMYGQQRQRQSILVLFFLLILPLVALAQSNTGSAQVSTIFSVASSGTVTSIATILTTITNTASSSSASGNSSSSASGNSTSTASGNSTATKSQSHTSDTSTTPSNLPTASTDGVNGGGGTAGAPSPGATDSSGNKYGPDDSYIAGATALQRNGLFIGLVGLVVGVVMTLL
ncbi:uncharacterized protein EV420DRAFT_941769 [Desarmillaria tabescens]|uniref:Uncharacterized protein n=1 Tax=Armillaria tabescens TaxID=1929756 RepID=A0AA39NGD9_ARMTA|nr:uncharacterized protein EV420DRAFT_941769 [Desarmillaria tabescens]KAK0465153.1 hypothetical protein EV420DRAFT_941769 [Desarmillaria tabescens]